MQSPSKTSEGAFIGFEEGQVIGWAWDALRPDQTLMIELYANGVPIGSGRAEHLHPRAPDEINGHVFLIACSNLNLVNVPFHIRGVIQDTGKELSSTLIVGNEVELQKWLKWYDGEVWQSYSGEFIGYAIKANAPSEILIVDVYCNDRLVETIKADAPEPYSKYGAGHGFSYTPAFELADGSKPQWRFQIKGSTFGLRQSEDMMVLVPAGILDSRLKYFENEIRRQTQFHENERRQQAAIFKTFSIELLKHVDAVLAAQRDAFTREIHRIRPKTKNLSILPASRKPKRSLNILLDEHVIGFGWHKVEKTDDSGIPFRWMADTAGVVFSVDDTSALHLRIRGMARLDAQNDLRLHLNGEPVMGALADLDDGNWEFTAELPKDLSNGAPVSILTLTALYSRPPFQTDDYRRLSFAVASVSMEPIT